MGQTTLILDKTTYQNWRVCARYAWNLVRKRYDGHDEADEFKFKEGYRVEQQALGLFPGCHVIEGNRETVLRQTTNLIQQPGAKVLAQATALADSRFLAKADIIRVKADRGLELYEVKASGSPGLDGDNNKDNRQRFLHDIAFQKMVFEKSGHKISRVCLVYINKGYVLKDPPIDVNKFFKTRAVDQEVADLAEVVETGAEQARTELVAETEPVCQCVDKAQKDRCKAFRVFNPELDVKNSILDISRIHAKKLAGLRGLGIRTIPEIDDRAMEHVKFSPKQLKQIEATQKGEVYIDKPAIKERLGGLEQPLYFLDYETINYALPFLEGGKPYQQVPFQFSLYVLKAAGDPVHLDYLMRDATSEELDGLIEHLAASIGPAGSIVAWHAAAERFFQSSLAQLRPNRASFLEGLSSRLFDLEKIFTDQHYVHPAFEGKTSLKKVLPVLVPSLNYSDLNIQEGSLASYRWDTALTESPAIKEGIFADLRKYCQRDTLAMVEIYRHLQAL